MDKLIIEFNKKFDKQKQELIDGFKALGEEKRLPKALATIEGEQPTYKNYFKAGWQSRQAELDQLNEVLDERTKEWLEAIKLGTYFQDVAKPLKDEVEKKDKRIKELELTLTQIKLWESHPKNYETNFGSWGLRDFYRALADKALRGEHE